MQKNRELDENSRAWAKKTENVHNKDRSIFALRNTNPLHIN